MLGLAALRAAGSGLESGYSRGRACAISGSDTLSRKKLCVRTFPSLSGSTGRWPISDTLAKILVCRYFSRVHRGVQPSDTLDTPFFELMRAREKISI